MHDLWATISGPHILACTRMYVEASALGLLGEEPYASVVGDSNVYGVGVNVAETLPAQLQLAIEEPIGLDPTQVQVAGFGVPARRLSGAADVAAALAEPITGFEVLVVDVDRTGRASLASELAAG